MFICVYGFVQMNALIQTFPKQGSMLQATVEFCNAKRQGDHEVVDEDVFGEQRKRIYYKKLVFLYGILIRHG